MREIRTLRSMSGERKRSDGSQSPKPPRLSSTLPLRQGRTTMALILATAGLGQVRDCVELIGEARCRIH